MKYRNGFFYKQWEVEIDTIRISYASKDTCFDIRYQEILDLRIKLGLIWDTLVISGRNSPSLMIDGLSNKQANQLDRKIRNNVARYLAGELEKHLPAAREAMSRFESLLNERRYLADVDVRRWKSNCPAIGQEIGEILDRPLFQPNFLPDEEEKLLRRFTELNVFVRETIKEHNDRFVTWALEHYGPLFDSLEKYPLTEEQKRAAVIDEDRNLLVAAAGSGKSSTIVAKVAYLLNSGLARPSEILALTYNKDAQKDINSRLEKLQDRLNGDSETVKAKTFHAQGLEIIATVEKQKPAISKLASEDPRRLVSPFSKLIEELKEKDSGFKAGWLMFHLAYKNPITDFETIKGMKQYEDHLRQLGARRSTSGSRRLVFPTIDGREVKSQEEARICNWLTINGIEYEYERPYEHPSANSQRGRYHPDFYYPSAKLYHEHFALDKNGRAPPFFKGYEEGVRWKRQQHEKNKTKLIETHSAHFRDGTIFDRLDEMLNRVGIQKKPMDQEKLDELVAKNFDSAPDMKLFSAFLRHFKSNAASMDRVRQRAKESSDPARALLFVRLFERIFDEYQQRLNKNNEIDFEDQIHKACDYLEKGKFPHPFKYILVDEFQDTSQDRKRMVHALIDQDEDTKLFAVGDDWQSIYRFTGVDIDIMTRFSEHFGTSSVNALTKTFRSYSGIVDVAAEFIQRNPNQIKKTVTAHAKRPGCQVIVKSYSDIKQQNKMIEGLLDKINRKADKNDNKPRVFLLARYNRQKPDLPSCSERFSNLAVEFKTIHSAKGLEADYVILLAAEAGFYGFPCVFTDDPILNLVIPHPEAFLNAEERRLMYVAITRAKRGVFILANKHIRSVFATELAQMKGVDDQGGLIQAQQR